MKPIDIGTRGYLNSPLSIATMGHLSIELVIIKHEPADRGGFTRRMQEASQEVERRVYLKRNPRLIREEDELTLILQSFLICQS